MWQIRVAKKEFICWVTPIGWMSQMV
jgi:hypothetical protein